MLEIKNHDQSDVELAAMIAKFRTPSDVNWEPLRDDLLTVFKAIRRQEAIACARLAAVIETEGHPDVIDDPEIPTPITNAIRARHGIGYLRHDT